MTQNTSFYDLCYTNVTLCKPPESEWPLERVVSTVVPVFFGIIGLIGFMGNLLVIVVCSLSQQFRCTTNTLIINLAIADILFVIFCVPFTATDYVLSQWPFGDEWCKFVQYMIVVTCHASVYTLVLLSFDRYLAVVHAVISMPYRNKFYTIVVLITAWTIIIITGIPAGLAHGVVNYPYYGNNYTACLFLVDEGYNIVAFQVSFFLSSYIIPLLLISLMYISLLSRLWKSPPSGHQPSKEQTKGKKRITRLVVVVVVVFAVCWLPIQIILVLKSLHLYGSSVWHVSIQIISHVLAYTNSCVNPVLYAFLSENFRVGLRKVMLCRKPHAVDLRNHQTKARCTTGNGTSQVDIV